MHLRELVERYLAAAGGFGRELALDRFGLSVEETERLFGFLDEDYHISRYFHFSNNAGTAYTIGGERATHVSIDPEVREIL